LFDNISYFDRNNAMRKLSYFLCLLVGLYFSISASAQSTDTTEFDQVFIKAETDPSFPGGLNAYRRFLEKNLDPALPQNFGAPSGSHRVVVQFIVDKDGSISAIKPLTSLGYGMEDEFVRVIKKSPKWVPATQNGHKVKCYFKLPMTFIVP
jgi:protein TonB